MLFSRSASLYLRRLTSNSAQCSVKRLSILQGQHSHLSTATSLGSVLVLSNLYPQPSASAAGVRTSYILDQLCQDPDWSSVHYATGAASAGHDDALQEGVMFHSVPPNRSSQIQDLLSGINDLSLVIFDRFHVEEAYSFHIYNHSPDAIRVLDMQDMHSLRQGRQAVIEKATHCASWDACLQDSVEYRPSSQDSILLRELASLHRSDFAMVCSPFEQELLANMYNIPSWKLCPASFWVSQNKKQHLLNFDERRDFCIVGGFRHPPNVDAVQQLAHVLWPPIRKALKNAQLHVYGAYCPPHIRALHNPAQGFLVHGFCSSLSEALLDKRVMLAPLRYGAGIKGKIVDSWMHGVPVVTTCIGSEGIDSKDAEWGGIVAESVDEFVDGAIRLYTDQTFWDRASKHGESILNHQFNESQWKTVSDALKEAVRNRDERRRRDYNGAMLWHHSARSTEYFSRWIECKESKPP